jgi:hypothetical protein
MMYSVQQLSYPGQSEVRTTRQESFSMSNGTTRRSIQPSLKWVPATFSTINRMWRGVDHPPTTSTELKGKVYLYF